MRIQSIMPVSDRPPAEPNSTMVGTRFSLIMQPRFLNLKMKPGFPASWKAGINIGVNDSIMGQVIGYSMGNEIRNHLEINVSENSLIYGEVHCNGWLDLQGTVMGSVTTADLYYSRSGIFQNTFINGKIDILSLSKNYLSSNWMKQGQPRILKYENF